MPARFASLRVTQRSASVWRAQIERRPERNDLVRIDRRVTGEIMMLDVLDAAHVRDIGRLINVAQIARERLVICDALQIAFEVIMIDGVEAKQRREEANVRFGEHVAQQETLL